MTAMPDVGRCQCGKPATRKAEAMIPWCGDDGMFLGSFAGAVVHYCGDRACLDAVLARHFVELRAPPSPGTE